MNKSFSLQQISKTGNIDSNLISRQNKLNFMAKYMQIKFENTKMKQSEIAKDLGCSSSTLQRYKNEINIVSPPRIQPNTTNKRSKKVSDTTLDNNSHREKDLKRSQMTSKRSQTNQLKNLKKNKLKSGGIIRIDVNYLDEVLHNNRL